MGWEDRPYYRDNPNTGANPLMWLLTGSVPLFTIFNIRVRAHAMLVVLVVFTLLIGISENDTAMMRVQSMTMLFIVILLHEFGHCFAARWTGGEANEILMTPLGGLAYAMARRKPWPTFVTVAGGPAVNVLICLVCAIIIAAIGGGFPLTPWSLPFVPRHDPFMLYGYLFWIYSMSFALLVFNLIPAFPLDGGQLLQTILWKPLGYYRSMVITMNVGLVLSVLMIMIGIATWGTIGGGLLLIFIALMCLQSCMQTRAMLRAEGPWAFQEEDEPDYGNLYAAAYEKPTSATSSSKTKVKSAARSEQRREDRAAKRAAKLAREEADEQREIDEILAKVSAHGMQSLTDKEQSALRAATERQRERDAERARIGKK
jgi:stage IV sporulation protein FB